MVLWPIPWTSTQPPLIVKVVFQPAHSGFGEALEAFAALRTAVWKSVKDIGFCCIFVRGAGVWGSSMAGPGSLEVSGSSRAHPGHLQRRHRGTWDDQGISVSSLDATQELMNALWRFFSHKAYPSESKCSFMMLKTM